MGKALSTTTPSLIVTTTSPPLTAKPRDPAQIRERFMVGLGMQAAV